MVQNIILALVAGLMLTLMMPATAEMEDWQYQRDITIHENSGMTLNDFQVLVELSGTDFMNEIQTDCEDIRFTDADGNSLSYWIEEFNEGLKYARIWVKVPEIPANSKTGIVMWYGNPSADSASDGDAVFEFFDDFDGSSLDEDKWAIEVGENGGRVEVSGGVCKLLSPNPSPCYSIIISKKIFDINSILVVKRTKVTTGIDSRGPMQRQGFRSSKDSTTGEVENVIDHGTEFMNEMWVRWVFARDGNSFNANKDWADVGISEGTWYTSSVAWYEDDGLRHVAWFKNNIRVPGMDYSSNDCIPSSRMHLWLYSSPYGGGYDNTGYMAVDYAFVRKYISSEPTITFSTIELNISNIRSNSLLYYTLSGGSSPETPLMVDDDLEVKVNGENVFIDDDGYTTLDGRGSWKGDPVTFLALPGDELEIIATNSGGKEIELSELYLHAGGESVQLSGGVQKGESDVYEFFSERFTISIPTPSVRVLDIPSSVSGGEEMEVMVDWSNIPEDWKLVVSLEISETDKTRLADDVEKTIFGSGNDTFKLNVHSVDETYDQAKVWVCLRDENDIWASVFTDTDITVLPSPPKPIITPEETTSIPPTYLLAAAAILIVVLVGFVSYLKNIRQLKEEEDKQRRKKEEEMRRIKQKILDMIKEVTEYER